MISRARRRPAALLIALGTALWCRSALPADNGPPQQAGQILAATGVSGGLVVHLGCGDGKLTAALGAGPSYTVHGLDADPAHVAKARAHVESLGLYGRVTIDHWQGDRLPYVDNLVNLLVVGDGPRVSSDEMLRVLAPDATEVSNTGRWRGSRSGAPSNDPCPQIRVLASFRSDSGNPAAASNAAPPASGSTLQRRYAS